MPAGPDESGPDVLERELGQLARSDERIFDAHTRGEALVCPETDDQPASGATLADKRNSLSTPNHVSYLYFGRGLRKQNLTPNHVLACDKPHNHDRGQYDLWVLYGDFSVRRMPRPQLEKLLPELESGHNPPRSEKLR